MHQPETGVDVLFRTADLFRESLNGIDSGFDLHQSSVTSGLVQFMNVGALQVFDELQL